MMRKYRTRRMIEIEDKIGTDLAEAIIDLYEKSGSLTVVAAYLGVSQSTLYGWLPMLELDIQTRIVRTSNGNS